MRDVMQPRKYRFAVVASCQNLGLFCRIDAAYFGMQKAGNPALILNARILYVAGCGIATHNAGAERGVVYPLTLGTGYPSRYTP